MKILIIDDELDLLENVRGILTKEGFEVESASEFKEANRMISNNSYDLVICDIMLPHFGGFDLVDAVKENPEKQKTPVIVITGMDRDILESTRTFADICLVKPFTGKQLLEAVRSLVAVS
jgi:DNA-binding response OmpR family regulator